MKEKLNRNAPCWCGSGKKYKHCHLRQDMAAERAEQRQARREAREARRASRAQDKPQPHPEARKVLIKTEEQIEGIRKSCQLTRQILDELEDRVTIGMTTDEIDRWVHEYTLDHGATPAPLHYRGYPKSVCTSLNEVVCHGIPGARALRDGDILNIDVTCILDGYYGDSSRMWLIGDVSGEARRLVQVTRECLDLGIEQVKPGKRVGDIGQHLGLAPSTLEHHLSTLFDAGLVLQDKQGREVFNRVD